MFAIVIMIVMVVTIEMIKWIMVTSTVMVVVMLRGRTMTSERLTETNCFHRCTCDLRFGISTISQAR